MKKFFKKLFCSHQFSMFFNGITLNENIEEKQGYFGKTLYRLVITQGCVECGVKKIIKCNWHIKETKSPQEPRKDPRSYSGLRENGTQCRK